MPRKSTKIEYVIDTDCLSSYRRFGLDIIDLDSPLNPPRRLRHGQSWNVADVQWSPFAARDYWVASTSNQKAIVWNLSMPEDGGRGSIEHTLQGHTRAITDINFSAHHPDILSTCAVDGYVHCWDLRRPRRPAMTFCDWAAGATQVKWNRQDAHILASSHDRFLRIWDDRKGAYPLRSIEAHSSKIYGVDWNRTRATGIVTCSLDKSIKFWDYGNEEDVPERVIRTDFPVWRARHTPFGWGLLAMPQDIPGNLHLYDRRKDDAEIESSVPEVAIFPGHGDKQVKEFLWRSRGGVTNEGIDNREFQLVSWGEDNQLRLQRLDSQTLEAVGYFKGSQLRKKLNVTRKGAVYKTFRNVEKSETEKSKASIRGPRHSTLTDSMDRMSSKAPRGHLSSGRAAMRGKAVESVNQNKVGWMSGIKFSTQAAGEPRAGKTSHERRLSVMSPNFDAEWDIPENLHDEIIRVHDQYTKVSFDDVNMDRRAVSVSMNGPWGEGGESVYIQVTIEFPDQYPEVKLPVFTIGKSSLINQETYDKIAREVQQIATGFVGQKKGCLEATICYLLGEIDLEESTVWLNGSQDVDDIGDLADESSSDDDDSDMPAGSSAMMSQELDSSATDGMLIPIHRHVNVPTPRLSGARFSNNGKLVCYFPPKTENVKSLLGTSVDRERARGEPFFNTFARLRTTVAVPHSNLRSITDDGEDPDSSSDSDDSSSSESDSSRFRGGVAYGFWRKVHGSNYRNALSTNRSQRSSAAGTGTGTGTGTLGSRARQLKPKNIIALHDISQFTPAKQELANEYAIFGSGADVCTHNSLVARQYGHDDLADIWEYAGMLLQHEVPLEILDKSHRNEPLLVVAHDMIKRCRRDSTSDSGVDVSNDDQEKNDGISGRVKWGYSPLAKPLIEDLFDHFERLADVQMLAMLSCVFSEPSTSDGVSRAEMHLPPPETPLSMKTPGFSLDYFPTDAAAWSNLHKTPHSSKASTPKTAHTPVGLYGSVGSSNGGPWGSDPASASYSCGETPPLRSGRGSAEKLLQHAQSIPASPDEVRSVRRTNVGLASSFAANLTRSFSATISSSPPHRKRISPVESLLNSLAPSAVTWGNTTVFESIKGHAYSGRSSFSEDGTLLDEARTLPVTGISMTVFNQDAFDDDGCMSIPFLDHSHAELYSSYRRAYAELLDMWGCRLVRLEILKFDSLPDYFQERDASHAISKSLAASVNSDKGSSQAVSPTLPSFMGKKDSMHPSASVESKGLDITGYCLTHEYRLQPIPSTSAPSVGGAVGRCERCKLVKSQLRCVICCEPVAAVYTACLSCGCATHPQCLDQYHDDGERQCAGGCDCDCSVKAGMGLVESWEAMMGAIEMLRKLNGHHKPRKSEEWEIEGRGDWGTTTPDSRPESRHPPSPGLGMGMGYTNLSRRLGQVRSTDWGSGLRRKKSLLRREEGV